MTQGGVKKIDNRFNCMTGTNINEVLCLAKCECDKICVVNKIQNLSPSDVFFQAPNAPNPSRPGIGLSSPSPCSRLERGHPLPIPFLPRRLRCLDLVLAPTALGPMRQYKTAELSQRRPRDAPNIWVPWKVSRVLGYFSRNLYWAYCSDRY